MVDSDRIVELMGEWHQRLGDGDSVDPEEFAAEHPECAEELLRRLRAIEAFDRAAAESSSVAPLPDRIGDFEILRQIGAGGMGVVYEAEQQSMSRRVALKVLTPSRFVSGRGIDRFRREAQVAGRLHHTNVVPVYALGEDRGTWYYAMELVRGRPLSDVLCSMRDACRSSGHRRSETWSGSSTSDDAWYREVAAAFAGVAEALELAHSEGVVHRDIKPSNLLLDADGTLKVVDFGVAHLEGPGPRITRTGDLIGTPSYMSPEQASGGKEPADHRSDVYSLGATLYETLALRPPFEGDKVHDVCAKILSVDPRPLRRLDPGIPRNLQTIVERAMEKTRERRYSQAADLARDLRHFANGEPIGARRVGPLARAWRKIQSHKTVSALSAALIIVMFLAAWLGWLSAIEAEQRTSLEYSRLCASGALIETHASSRSLEPIEAISPEDSLARAIALDPDRPQAYFLRALRDAKPTEERLADLDAARDRGLRDATFFAARAHVLREGDRIPEADAAEKRAATHPIETPADAYFLGALRADIGQVTEALELFGRAVDDSDPRSAIALLARNRRAIARQKVGNHSGALRDLHAVQASGDHSVWLRVRIASVWEKLDQSEVAEAQIEELFAELRGSGSLRDWEELGTACEQLRHGPWLTRAATEGVERFPRSSRLLVSAGFARYLDRDFEGYLETADAAVKLSPDEHATVRMQGAALSALKEWEKAAAAFRRSLEILPTCVDCKASLAHALYQSGDYQEAHDLTRGALKRDPRLARAWTMLGLVLHKLEDLEGAEAAFLQALGLDGRLADAHRGYGALLADGFGKSEEARQRFVRSLELDDESATSHFNLGVVCDRLGDLEEARSSYTRAVDLSPASYDYNDKLWGLLRRLGESEELKRRWRAVLTAKLRDTLDVRHLRAHAFHNLGQLDEARRRFRELCEESPDVEFYVDLGVVLYDLGQFADAIQAYQAALKLDDTLPQTWNNLGNAWHREGNRVEALRCFGEALTRQPEYPDALYNRGGLYKDMGRFEDALQDFDAALKRIPRDSALHMKKGSMLLEQMKRPKQAIAAFQKALEINPDQVDAYSRIAIANMRLREPDAAEAALSRGLQRLEGSHEGSASLHMLRARIRKMQKRPKEALRDFDAALAIQPRNARLHLERGMLLQDQLGKSKAAIQAFEKVVEIDPKLGDAYRCLAVAHGKQNLRAAEAALTRGLEQLPNDGLLREIRGRIRATLGRPKEAIADFETALATRDRADLRHVLAEVCIAADDPKRALLHRRRALAHEPRNPMLLNALAWHLVMAPDASRRDHLEARDLARSAVTTDSGNASYKNTLGAAHCRLGAFAESIQAIGSGGKSACDHFVLAVAFHGLGKLEKARQHFARGTAELKRAKTPDPDALSWRRLAEERGVDHR